MFDIGLTARPLFDLLGDTPHMVAALAQRSMCTVHAALSFFLHQPSQAPAQ